MHRSPSATGRRHAAQRLVAYHELEGLVTRQIDALGQLCRQHPSAPELTCLLTHDELDRMIEADRQLAVFVGLPAMVARLIGLFDDVERNARQVLFTAIAGTVAVPIVVLDDAQARAEPVGTTGWR